MGFELTLIVVRQCPTPIIRPYGHAVGGLWKTDGVFSHVDTVATQYLGKPTDGKLVSQLYHNCSTTKRPPTTPGWYPTAIGGDEPTIRDKYHRYNQLISLEQLMQVIWDETTNTKDPVFHLYLRSAFACLEKWRLLMPEPLELHGILYGH